MTSHRTSAFGLCQCRTIRSQAQSQSHFLSAAPLAVALLIPCFGGVSVLSLELRKPLEILVNLPCFLALPVSAGERKKKVRPGGNQGATEIEPPEVQL